MVGEGDDWVYGTFSCMAKNIRGHQSTEFELVRAGRSSQQLIGYLISRDIFDTFIALA